MDRSQKTDAVAQLNAVFNEAGGVVITRNLALSVAQSTDRPRLRVMTTTPASLKTALSWATASVFCERSMPYSFTMTAVPETRRRGRLTVVHAERPTRASPLRGKECTPEHAKAVPGGAA